MKPFQFSLQPLRILREQQERAAQQAYAGALRVCEEAAARVQSASAELTACWTTLRDKMSAGVVGLELLRARAWCNVLELRLKERAAALEQARLGVDAAWKAMLQATREREALDRYRDKRRATYERQQQREEQKSLDELAVQLTEAQTPFRYFSPGLESGKG
jgi:flagellar export protein FliJ